MKVSIHHDSKTRFLFPWIMEAFLLQSFADSRCSGRSECKLRVSELVHNAQPCPLELSSYFEAAFHCISGIIKMKYFLQSFADMKCSGRSNCEIKVSDMVHKSRPCPLELSSYLEASFHCLAGNIVGLNYVNLVKITSGMTIWVWPNYTLSFWSSDVNMSFLQSFVDKQCSGKANCQFKVSDIVHNSIIPCPLELSSYLEAAFWCINGNQAPLQLNLNSGVLKLSPRAPSFYHKK